MGSGKALTRKTRCLPIGCHCCIPSCRMLVRRPIFEPLAQSRVVARLLRRRSQRKRLRSLLLSTAARDFRRSRLNQSDEWRCGLALLR